tara:strand:- start:1665 stop:2057 length:393 start_codon:yes stop_codon:yes gene_type:complete
MKKNDLKKLIKPLVKECIQEVLLEEGLLSNVVSEVAKGLQPQNMVVEANEPQLRPAPSKPNPDTATQRKKLLDAIGKDAYNGVDLFEGTMPLSSKGPAKPGSIDLGEAGDSGVDISSLMGNATKLWDMMK